MRDKNPLYTFCAMQPESLVVLCALQEKKEQKLISKREDRQLQFLQERRKEGDIWLLPPLIFAAANQKSCREFFLGAAADQKAVWHKAGVAWLRYYPAFLNRIGWQERQQAILAAGFLAGIRAEDPEGEEGLRRFFSESWGFLWSRILREEGLGVSAWEELLMPWEDSPAMESAMAAVFLCMAALQKKPVRDIDQLWRSLRRLKAFSENCIKKPERVRRPLAVAEGAAWPGNVQEGPQKERLDWLFTHFKNPQRIAYLKEKGRISSEWLDTLFTVMEKAGLPRSACESMQIGGDEVMKLLDCFTDRASERQYITFLLLYTVSRELVKAGQLAAIGRMTAAGREGLPEKL